MVFSFPFIIRFVSHMLKILSSIVSVVVFTFIGLGSMLRVEFLFFVSLQTWHALARSSEGASSTTTPSWLAAHFNRATSQLKSKLFSY